MRLDPTNRTPAERAAYIAEQLKKEIGLPPSGRVGVTDDGETLTMSMSVAAVLLAKLISMSETVDLLRAQMRELQR